MGVSGNVTSILSDNLGNSPSVLLCLLRIGPYRQLRSVEIQKHGGSNKREVLVLTIYC